MTETDATYAILLGADMDPERIRLRPDLEEARFDGIGEVTPIDLAGVELPLPEAEEIWGVVVRLPAGAQLDGPVVPVTLRTGEGIEATVLTAPADLDNPEAVLAEARYWELPAAYRETLERWSAGEQGDPDLRSYS